MPYFAPLARPKRPIPLGATVRFEHSADPIPHEVTVSAKVFGPPSTHGRDAAAPSATRPRAHPAEYGQLWDYATPHSAWVVLPNQTAHLVAVRDMVQVDDEQDAPTLPLGDDR